MAPRDDVLELQLSLARMENVPEQIADHETRLRVLEKGMVKLTAILGVAGAVGSALGSVLMKMLVG
jgi:hypothetical protein